MTLQETMGYIEQGELPERFGAYDNDMRSYALVANGVEENTVIQKLGRHFGLDEKKARQYYRVYGK